jgi:hypothetical protein
MSFCGSGFGIGCGIGLLYSMTTVTGLSFQVGHSIGTNAVSVEPPTNRNTEPLYITPPSRGYVVNRSISPITRSCSGGGLIKGYNPDSMSMSLSPVSSCDSPLPKRRSGSRIMSEGGQSVRRQLDFSVSVSHSVSVSPPTSPRILVEVGNESSVPVSPISLDSNAVVVVVADGASVSSSEEFIGECSVCYDPLPLRSNHIYTVCGHLFCVKCLFRWGIQNPTCPFCREKLYCHDDAVDDDSEGDSVDDEGHEGHEGDGENGHQELVDNNNWNDDDNINNDEYTVNAWRDLVPRIDSYIHDDEGIEWTGEADMDDNEVPNISRGEIEELREARVAAISMISRHFCQTLLMTNLEITGGIIHTFIPRAEYMEINNNDIGRGGNFYEFVLCRRLLPQSEPCSEINLFGYITEIKVVEVRNAHLLSNQSWENTHEYCFVVEVFDSLWRSPTPVDAEGIIDLTECQQMTLRFSDVRRVYSVWTMTRVQSYE